MYKFKVGQRVMAQRGEVYRQGNVSAIIPAEVKRGQQIGSEEYDVKFVDVTSRIPRNNLSRF